MKYAIAALFLQLHNVGRPASAGAVGANCILRRVGECGVSVWIEQRGFVRPMQPHIEAQNIAANAANVYAVAIFEKLNYQIWMQKLFGT